MLQQNLQVLASALGLDIRYLRENGGDLSQLSDGDKTSLVAALNSLKEYANSYLDGVIHDASQSSDHAYSSNKIEATIQSAIDLIKVGAPEAYNTLKEMADYIAQDQTQTTNLITGIENTVRYDAPAILTVSQIKNVHETINIGDGLFLSLDEYISTRDAGLITSYHVYPLARTGLSKSFLLKNDQIIMQEEYQDLAGYGNAARQNSAAGISVSRDNDIIVSTQAYWILYGFNGRVMTVAKKQPDGSWTKQSNALVRNPIHTRMSRVHNDVLYAVSAGGPIQLHALKFNYETNNFDIVNSVSIVGNGASRWAISENSDGSLLSIYDQSGGTVSIYKVTRTDTIDLELTKTASFIGVYSHETNRPPRFSHTGRFIAGYPGTSPLNSVNRFLPILVNSQNAASNDFSDSFVSSFNTGVALRKDFVHLFSNEDVCAVQISTNQVRFYRIAISGDVVSYQLIHTLTGPTKTVVGMTPDDRYMFVWNADQITSDPIMEIWMRVDKESYDYQKIGEVDVGLTTTASNGGIGYFDVIAVK